MTTPSAPGRGRRIAVVGGGGFYGRYLVADLLRFTDAQVLVVSRRAPQRLRPTDRVVPVACDLRDPRALREAIRGSTVVVHCAGPFQPLPLEPLRAAIASGVHYVDIAEDRAYRRRVLAMDAEARAAGVVALNGASVVPGMEALFTELLRPGFDELLEVCSSAAPDTRRHRGHAMFHTMLLGAGRPFLAPRDGRPVRVHGWHEPEWFDFPPPVGRRLHYLVLEMADLDVLPELFGVGTVTFKAGSEFPWLNRLLAASAALRARTGHPRLEAYTPLVRGLSWLVGRFGNQAGGVIFQVSGRRGGMPQRQAVAVVGERDGGRIPAVLAGMAVEELLAGRLATPGVADLRSWLPPDRLVRGLVRRGLRLWWRQDAGAWEELRATHVWGC
jgi:NAD(P)-dependent dehydrogenase (short-subunit alcohol dehydrogenase family)